MKISLIFSFSLAEVSKNTERNRIIRRDEGYQSDKILTGTILGSEGFAFLRGNLALRFQIAFISGQTDDQATFTITLMS